MEVINNPAREEYSTLFARPTINHQSLSTIIQKVFSTVQRNGDTALRDYTQLFDGAALDQFKVTEQEFEKASNLVSESVKKAIKIAQNNICLLYTSPSPRD